ncbi:MAG TPA: glycogen synthase [Clostridiales bacterium]|nr:glycogen synthase [Clostridiales bacterium]
MKRKIKILYVSAEVAPYAQVGGLSEVGRSFPEALMAAGGFEVVRVMPLYQSVNCSLKYVADYSVPMDQGYETCVLKKDPDAKEVPTYFISNDRYFRRDRIYAYEDDGLRFFFFCRAVVQMLQSISFHPDIVHVNDWHTGMLPLLLKKEFPGIKSVYTIHNIAYQGFIPAAFLEGYLSEAEKLRLGHPEWLNFMKAGIIYADLITTVSPGYAKELGMEEHSHGMGALLEERGDKIAGILNGIDMEHYNPQSDKLIPYPYDAGHPELKKKNRTHLRGLYGLPDKDIPLMAMVTRLDQAKGIDILLKAISYSRLSTYQLIILGSGNPYYHGILSGVTATYGKNIVADFCYSEALARQVYAAADIYLMPSLFEPCGLGQMYAMRYGAVPVVNPVGGLRDTVIPPGQGRDRANGFHMECWSGQALAKEMERAVTAYHSPEWRKYIRNGMRMDFSWQNSVLEYRKYYRELLGRT